MYACSRGDAFDLSAQRLLRQRERLRLVVRRHRRVDVRAEHQRVAPIGHRRVRIEPRRLGERARRLGVIEREGEVDALVDEELRAFDRGGHRERVNAEVLQPRRQRRVGSGVSRRVSSGRS